MPAASAQEGTKRALIIAIGEYGTPPANPVTGQPLMRYDRLGSANDVPLVRGALEQQGFLPRDIRVLPDSQATATGIRAAFRRLVDQTREGDVVVIHYSGHGHRISNDNPNEDQEIDGFDELLVPYGAPSEFYEGYDGALHIRDDELGDVIAQIRVRATRTGNVTVFLDACYSGTGTRGDGAVRGREEPLGPAVYPAGATPGTRGGPAADDDRGTGIETSRGGATRGGEENLASFAVFTAASPRQTAKEVRDVDGRTMVGPLSYAIARALPQAGPGTTNRALFAALARSLSGKVTNQTPQMEGDADTQLFSNRLTQQLPYVVVDTVTADGVVLAGGTLLGLNPGTGLVVHPIGTSRPDAAAASATLRVRDATPSRAVAVIVSGAVTEASRGAWAFVTERTYGDLALRVQLGASLSDRDRTGLARLSETGLVTLVDEAPDVVILSSNGRPEARTTADDLLLGSGAAQVEEAVESFARNRYLRRLSFESPDLDIVLDLAPGARLVRDRDGRPTGCTAADWSGAEARPENLGGGQWRLAPGDAYWLRARNIGRRRAFVHLVDLRPRGEIDVMVPEAGQSAEQMEPGAELDVGCYVISADDVGHEVLKLFATSTAQDLRPWFQSRATRAAGLQGDAALSREMSIHIQPN